MFKYIGQHLSLIHISIKVLPATFTVDMGKEYKINKLTYVPRQSGGANGYITSYDLYVKKAESDDWTQVVTDGCLLYTSRCV